MSDALHELQSAMRQFAQERDWEQFHSPKNLAMALSIEASELMEHFQWLTEAQSRNLTEERKAQVGTEIADVLLYLLRLCDVLQIDPADTARGKLALNAKKVHRASRKRGNIKERSSVIVYQSTRCGFLRDSEENTIKEIVAQASRRPSGMPLPRNSARGAIR